MTQWGLDTLFNPAKRHMDEEKRRLQSTRSEVGDNSGGKRIDLASGKVTIRKSTDEESDDETVDASADDESSTDTSTETVGGRTAPPGKSVPKLRADKPAPSPAAIRAAQRRGRSPR